MEVIPSINEENLEEIKRKFEIAEKIGAEWAQIDFSDGTFGERKVFLVPDDLKNFSEKIKIEIDFMAQEPEEKILPWLLTGKIKRAIFHLETLNDLRLAKKICLENGVEPGISILFSTGKEMIFPFLKEFNFFQVLAVLPGFSGQNFEEEAIETIKFLRANATDAKIEIDGGVNEETARRAKEAGANVLTSSSFIFNDPDPFFAYKKLLEI
jgi:ribulose-phosphate 3-epimerase